MRRINDSKAREEFIGDAEEKLKKRIASLQRKISQIATDYIVSNVSTKDNIITDSAGNFNLVNRLDKVIKKEIDSEVAKLAEWYIKQILKISTLNRNYFKQFNATKQQIERALKKTLKQIGVGYSQGEVKIEQGGYLGELIDLSEPVKELKKSVRSLMAAGVAIPILRRGIKQRVIGGDGLGIVESKFDRDSKDTFNRADRSIGHIVSQDVGIRAAVFQGGLIETSRDFCIKRNNKVYTFDEIRSWSELEFVGKPKGNYNPFTDLGGYNCRHQLDFISDDLAIILRPELKQLWGIQN